MSSFRVAGDSTDAVPAFHATALRHPAAAELHTASFVPNDVHLGGDGAAPFIVLTGTPRGRALTCDAYVGRAILLYAVLCDQKCIDSWRAPLLDNSQHELTLEHIQAVDCHRDPDLVVHRILQRMILTKMLQAVYEATCRYTSMRRAQHGRQEHAAAADVPRRAASPRWRVGPG